MIFTSKNVFVFKMFLYYILLFLICSCNIFSYIAKCTDSFFLLMLSSFCIVCFIKVAWLFSLLACFGLCLSCEKVDIWDISFLGTEWGKGLRGVLRIPHACMLIYSHVFSMVPINWDCHSSNPERIYFIFSPENKPLNFCLNRERTVTQCSEV